jgi:integrase
MFGHIVEAERNMRGSLTEWGGPGSGKWKLRVYAGRDTRNRPTYLSRNLTGTRRQAESALSKLVADVERRQVTTNHGGSVGDLLACWLADIEPTRSLCTMREHRRSIERNILPVIGSLRLDRLTARHLDDLYRSMLARGLSPSSVRRHHAILSAALRRAVKWDWLARNPAERASPPGAARHATTAPSTEAVRRLLAAAQDEDRVLVAAVVLAAVTGARRGELCALRWSDVDGDRGTLTIARSLTVIRRIATEGRTKTHQRRDIAIDDTLGAFIAERQAEQRAFAEMVGAELVPDPYLLSRSANGALPCLPDGLTQAYSRLAAKTGVGGHLHELRHYAATASIASGADARTVAGRLGHAGPSTMFRIYSHAVEARDRELAGVLTAAVLGSVSAQSRNASQPIAYLGCN